MDFSISTFVATFKRFCTAGLPLLLALSLAPSGVNADGNGQVAFEFATMAAEPFGRSLAGAHLAAVDGPASTAWNPAGLGHLSRSEALLSHCSWIADTGWAWGALAIDLPGNGGGLGISCGVLRSGNLPGYDSEGNPTGTFSPLQAIGSIAYGHHIGERWSFGANVEGVIESDGESNKSMNFAFGGGIQWHSSNIDLGLTVQHLAPAVELGEEEFPMPATVRCGGSVRTSLGLILHGAIESVSRQDLVFLTGLEWRPVSGVSTLAGLELDSTSNNEQTSQMAFGVALDVVGTRVTYSFRPDEQFDASHQISLGLPLTSR